MVNENSIKDMIILYVADQQRSMDFYRSVLNKEPQLNVPGMTEFSLNANTILGLMPEIGIAKILGNTLPDPSTGNGIPRCEIYLSVINPELSFNKLIELGGTPISPPSKRDWGHIVAYGADPDGHVVAFAKKIE